MEKYDETLCRYSLNKTFGYHPATAHALIEQFGSAAALFNLGYVGLIEMLGAGYKDLAMINDQQYEQDARELAQIQATGARFLPDNDPNFPALLKECEDYPIGLYIRSETSDEDLFCSKRKFLAVIGTRDISSYGREWCGRIVTAIRGSITPSTVVSGLAFGADITAHRKALELGVPTIAVTPCGIDAVYPLSHKGDAIRISRAPYSAVVTDYPPRTSAIPLNFLRRNRIIAGLSHATILVESRIRGGGLMTSRLAFSYMRDVYALPGRTEDLRSQGCNALIKEKVAEAIISESELQKSLGLEVIGSKKVKQATITEVLHSKFSGVLDDSQIDHLSTILIAIKSSRGVDIEQLSRICSLPYRQTLELVSFLQCEGLIQVDLMQRCSIVH